MTEDRFEEMLRGVLEERATAREGLEGRVLARVAASSREGAGVTGWRGMAGVGGVLVTAVLVWSVGGSRAGGGWWPARARQSTGAMARRADGVGREAMAEVRPGDGAGAQCVVRGEMRRRSRGGAGRRPRGEESRSGVADGADRTEMPALGVGELVIAPLVVRPLEMD